MEGFFHLVRDYIGDGGLSHSWRSPQYHGGNVARLNGLANYATFSRKVFLSNQLIESGGSHSLCKWWKGIQKHGVSYLKKEYEYNKDAASDLS